MAFETKGDLFPLPSLWEAFHMYKRVIGLLLAVLFMVLPAVAEGAGGVADASDMTDVIDVVDESMTPVAADRLNDGVYAVAVDASSAMFKVVGCELTVADGVMTAKLYMKSEAYSYMYPGPAEEAAQADTSALTRLEVTDDGSFVFTLPVDALDAGYECAAFSARKQLWYPRTLVFRADSLPLVAWKDEFLTTTETLELEDGAYTCAVALKGEGRATLESPVALQVEGGACVARIVFGTAKIDYVIVDGEKCAPMNDSGNATFDVPVAAFDLPLSIVMDSTAIKPAVEVQYTMTFDSATIIPK